MNYQMNAIMQALMQANGGGGQTFHGKKGGSPMAQKFQPPMKKFAVEGASGPKAMGAVGGMTAEVRFDDPVNAQKALALNGSTMGGCVISVAYDETSKDGSKIIVKNVPKEAEWQELKDHFAQCGQVAFANVKGGGKGHLGPAVGTIRYGTAEEAAAAAAMLNGAILDDHTLEVKLHPGSSDKTKLQIFNLPPAMEWQELKDYFGQAGTVSFSEVLRGGNGKQVGEVRYDNPEHTHHAMALLNNSTLGGAVISVKLDMTSKDGTKLLVTGIPVGIEWQELKDHFGCVGTVAFCNVNQVGAVKGKGKGVGKGMNMMGGNMMGGCGGMAGKGAGGNQLQNLLMGLMGGQAGGKGKGNGCGFGGGKITGSVRYDNPLHCHFAIQMLNGTALGGGVLEVDFDYTSQDGSKLCVGGIAPGTQWQELKDHFGAIGTVAFCQVGPGKGKGKGKF